MSKRRITDDDIQKAQDEYDMWLTFGMADSDDGANPDVIRADEDFFIDALENLDDFKEQKAEQDAEDARIEEERRHEQAQEEMRRTKEELQRFAASHRSRRKGRGSASAPQAAAAAPASHSAHDAGAGQSSTDHAPAHAAKLSPVAIAFIVALWAVAILVFSLSLGPQANEPVSPSSSSSQSGDGGESNGAQSNGGPKLEHRCDGACH